jgi:purine-binding chemotaxis protein CheW
MEFAMSNAGARATVKHSNLPDEGLERKKAAGGKFLTFFLAGEEYGIEILSVHEIIGMLPTTSVPGTPAYICGIVNLRGKIIPIVNLRLKFGMESKAPTSETCIIVVNVQEVEVGIVVDRVSEVINIAAGDIEPAPSFGKDVNTDYILGIGKSSSKVKILLNIDRVLSADQIVRLQKMADEEAAGVDPMEEAS